MDWQNFALFDGPATLNTAILKPGPSFQEDVKKVHNWLITLRNNMQSDPSCCGIPSDKVEITQALLDKFFPIKTANDGTGDMVIDAVRIASTIDAAIWSADPLKNVSFGSSEFDITDGPAALGYIFSIQTKKPSNPTYDNFAVPLLVLYGRCIYLIYLSLRHERDSATGASFVRVDETTVPWTACIMYLNKIQGELPLYIGCTYVNGVTADPNDRVRTAGQQDMTNKWRRLEIIDRGMRTCVPTRALPDPSPKHLREIGIAFLKSFRGESIALGGSTLYTSDDKGATFIPWDFKKAQGGIIPQAEADQIFNTIEQTYQSLWKATPSLQNIVAAPRTDLENMNDVIIPPAKHLRDLLYESLQDVVQIRWKYGHVLNEEQRQRFAQELEQPFMAFIAIYLVPHMFFEGKPPFKYSLSLPEVAIPDPSGLIPKAKANLLTPLWQVHGTDVVNLLDQIHWWVVRDDNALAMAGPSAERFGRCSESYPVTALLPTWTPSRILPNTSGTPITPVRGFAIKVRRLHNDSHTEALSEHFGSDQLNAFHDAEKSDPFYALPCENCRTLLPAFDVPIGKDDYDADFWAMAPQQALKLSQASTI